VFSDDRVMCYTGANDVTGVAGEACFAEGLAWGKAFMMFSCFMDFKHFVNIYLTKLGICNRQL